MAEAALQRFEHDRANPKQRGADGHATGTYAASWLTQVWVCSGRALANVVRNPATSIGQVMVNIVVGVLVGCIFWQINGDNEPNRQMRDKTGFIFFVMVNLMFSNMGGIEVFLKERVIFMHEKASGYYRTSAYYVSKLLCDLVPVRVVPTAIFATTVYFMAGLQYKVDKFFWFLLIAELQSIAASAVCFLFSCMFSIFAIANLSTTMFYVLTMIFSGLLVSVTKWPDGTRWLGYTSFAKYSYELALENELTGLTFDCSRGGPCTGEEALGELYLNIETGNWGDEDRRALRLHLRVPFPRLLPAPPTPEALNERRPWGVGRRGLCRALSLFSQGQYSVQSRIFERFACCIARVHGACLEDYRKAFGLEYPAVR